jgi:hypothetical protein
VHHNRFIFSGSTECSVVYRNQFIQFRFRIRHDHSVQNLKLFSAHNEIETEWTRWLLLFVLSHLIMFLVCIYDRKDNEYHRCRKKTRPSLQPIASPKKAISFLGKRYFVLKYKYFICCFTRQPSVILVSTQLFCAYPSVILVSTLLFCSQLRYFVFR